MRAFDEEYEYHIKAKHDTIHLSGDLAMNEFHEAARAVGDKAIARGSLEEYQYHEAMKELSKKYRFTYERKKI